MDIEQRTADATPEFPLSATARRRSLSASARTYRLQSCSSATIARSPLPSRIQEDAARRGLRSRVREQAQVQLPERPTHRNYGCVLTGSVARPRRTEDGELPEADAIRLSQQGDAAAFERVYRLHSRRVYSLCLRMVGDPTEAEDLTQDVFLHLFRKIGTFRGESAFSTWLHRMAVNIVLMRLRRKRIAKISVDAIVNPGDESDTQPREFS